MVNLIAFLTLIYLFINYTEQASVVCDLPKRIGTCKANLQRYYYDNNTQKCMQFTYGGCGGNGNNFNNLEECQTTCLSQAISSPTDDMCSLPKVVGPCKASLRRYYFNGQTDKCELFTYSGCQGNDNNFNTLAECQNRCEEQEQELISQDDTCSLPKAIGPCKASLRRYFFNSQTSKCEQFKYGGCQGNDNNFNTLTDCQNRCEKQVQSPNNQDICRLPQESGMCLAYFPRFYYNSTYGQCKNFIYGGCGGNGNNFQTIEECQSSCSSQRTESVSCSLGEPLKQPFSSFPKPCNRNNPSSCPEDYTCNTTSFNSPGVCCPTQYMPPPPEFNPCKQGSPLKDARTGKQVSCKYPEMTCPNNYKCIYEIMDAPSVCCPPENQFYTSPQPIRFQTCPNGLPLVDARTGQQQRCSRTGSCPNGYECFSTQGGHQSICCPMTSVTDTSMFNPCQYGEPLRDFHTGQEQRCGFTNRACPNSYECFTEIADRPPVCCPKPTNNVESTDICRQPKKEGPCYASFVRYFYNSDRRQCEQFTFGGCQPNANNFGTLQECQRKCFQRTDVAPAFNPCQYGQPLVDSRTGEQKLCGFQTGSCPQGYQCFTEIADRPAVCCPSSSSAQLTDLCKLPKQVGLCYASFQRYFFNTQLGQCEEFIYGGCQGNANNFMTLQECQKQCNNQDTDIAPFNPCQYGEPLLDSRTGQEQKCGFRTGTCPGGYQCLTTIADRPAICCPVASSINLTDICSLPKKVGPCKASLNRFYYNYDRKQCEQFTFGGCQENANNFVSLDECQRKCNSQDTEISSFNPCETGEPLRDNRTNQERRCGFNTRGCPNGYRCISNIADHPSVCCPRT